MKVLVTGAGGFVGRNLVASLESIRDGLDRVHRIRGLVRPDGTYAPQELEIVTYCHTAPAEALAAACRGCDFVFHLAGVNRPRDNTQFRAGNTDFTAALLDALKEVGSCCPVLLASSVQASLAGRYEDSPYGQSKYDAEQLVFGYGAETGAQVYVYRFPNLFGKWCRPNYNSVVATFCHNIARRLPITVSDSGTELTLAYIDDCVEEMLLALNGKEHRCMWRGVKLFPCADGYYCYVPVTHRATLGQLVQLLETFRDQSETHCMPALPEGSLTAKLYATYLSYLPEDAVCYRFPVHADARGSFTELIKTADGGQFSVNVSEPGVTKGQHWHHSKWELFIVVHGRALIQERRIGTDEDGNPYPVLSFTVSGDTPEAVHMLPGYTHSIRNLSDTDKLVTLMWASERFDPNRPDTFAQRVEQE